MAAYIGFVLLVLEPTPASPYVRFVFLSNTYNNNNKKHIFFYSHCIALRLTVTFNLKYICNDTLLLANWTESLKENLP